MNNKKYKVLCSEKQTHANIFSCIVEAESEIEANKTALGFGNNDKILKIRPETSDCCEASELKILSTKEYETFGD